MPVVSADHTLFSLDELTAAWEEASADPGFGAELNGLLRDFVGRQSDLFSAPQQNRRHEVKPGITGWAQVNGYRGDTSIKKRIEYDLYYIENWNVFFDLKILLMTLTRSMNSEKIVH